MLAPGSNHARSAGGGRCTTFFGYKDTWTRAGLTALEDYALSRRRLAPPCSLDRYRIRPRCMGCSYRSFVSVSCCFRLRQARPQEAKRPQTDDPAHHSTPSRHVRSSDEQAPYTAANQPLDLDAVIEARLRVSKNVSR